MKLLVVTAFHSGDIDAAVRLYDWIRELGGIDNDVLLVHDPQDDRFKCNRVLLAAKRAAKNVIRIQTSGLHKKEWPHGPNAAFLSASKWAFDNKRNFLWLETDCVPTKRGWLSEIEREYASCGKRYLGGIVPCKPPLPPKVMYGVAVYDHRAFELAAKAIADHQGIAFDVAMSEDTVPLAAASKNLQLARPVKGNTVPDIRKDIVLFHSDKTGLLIKSLSSNETSVRDTSTTSHAVVSNTSEVTVVITNFKRPEMLLGSFKSCMDAKVEHIVVSSSGTNDAVRAVHKRILEAKPSTVITSIDTDEGCNETWLRGARLVKTSRTTILHDDDLLLPAFERVVAGEFKQDVIHWDGAKHGDNGVIPGLYVTNKQIQEGVHPVQLLLAFLTNTECYTLSPVCGNFPTSHVLAVLDECEKRFDRSWMLRGKMMVGNDLMLWLRACEKLNTMYYSHTPFNSYGHWNGSTSYRDCVRNEMRLLPLYTKTRHYWLDNSASIIHLVPRYFCSDDQCNNRLRYAERTWDIAYSNGLARRVDMWSYPRTSWSIGDKRQVPFLKDVLRYGMDQIGDQDVMVLTNDDTLINQYFWCIARNTLMNRGAFASFRSNLLTYNIEDAFNYPQSPKRGYGPGRDAFAFKRSWLQEHLDEIPDYVLAHTDWDSTLAMLIRITNGCVPTAEDYCKEHPSSEIDSRFIGHLEHDAYWVQTPETVGNKYNRKLSDEFFKTRLGWPVPKLGVV